MAVTINLKKCDFCEECIGVCPFDAIDVEGRGDGHGDGDGDGDGHGHGYGYGYGYGYGGSDCNVDSGDESKRLNINAACKNCGLCIKACKKNAITIIDDARKSVDKNEWQGILVYGEMDRGRLHPVVRELIGKALILAEKRLSYDEKRPSDDKRPSDERLSSEEKEKRATEGKEKPLIERKRCEVSAVIIGDDTKGPAFELLSYGVDMVYTYEHEAFRYFKADSFAACYADIINIIRPEIVLTGATSVGRSLAPRVSARLRTGLTADCTSLELTKEGDLVQIRPAFGGNIMAEIITPKTRPQFATVRYKVMDEAKIVQPHGEIVQMQVTGSFIKSGIELISAKDKPPSENISEADVLVVGGKGLKAREDLEMVKELAKKLNGQYAVTRPLVEAGWAPQIRQIGLSGRTVKPKLILTFGVSGAVQFTAAMRDSECIFAVNSDRNAPIMDVAHYGVVGNLYEILPGLLEA